MTKAQCAVIQEKVDYPPSGMVPADINICRDDVRSLLSHIDALEARTRELLYEFDQVYDGPESKIPSGLVEAICAIRAAVEGEK